MPFLFTKRRKEEYIRSMTFGPARKHSQLGDIVKRLMRNKLSIIGLVIIAALVVVIVFAPLFTQYKYDIQDYPNKFLMPNGEHLMGTDNYGRDIWTRCLYGGRISLLVAIVAVAIATSLGIVLGSVAGYWGGVVDLVISRILDIVMSIPSLLLAIAISAALGSGPIKTALAVSVTSIPVCARIVRSNVMTIKGQEFIEAARSNGSSHLRTIFRHILPNILSPVIVNSTLQMGGCILAISGLSFIGLGVQPPVPEWGSILSEGREFIRTFWPMTVFPGIFIALTMFGFNLFGDGLRDALDPKLKQ